MDLGCLPIPLRTCSMIAQITLPHNQPHVRRFIFSSLIATLRSYPIPTSDTQKRTPSLATQFLWYHKTKIVSQKWPVLLLATSNLQRGERYRVKTHLKAWPNSRLLIYLLDFSFLFPWNQESIWIPIYLYNYQACQYFGRTILIFRQINIQRLTTSMIKWPLWWSTSMRNGHSF